MPRERTARSELLSCAHLGFAALYLGDLQSALSAGRALKRLLDLQPSPRSRFYLRIAAGGDLQTACPAEAAGLPVIAEDQPGEAWLFIGYPMAFLARLYRATGESSHLDTALGYPAFHEGCAPRMLTEYFAHKVAWGAAALAAVTGETASSCLSWEITGNHLSITVPTRPAPSQHAIGPRLRASREVRSAR